MNFKSFSRKHLLTHCLMAAVICFVAGSVRGEEALMDASSVPLVSAVFSETHQHDTATGKNVAGGGQDSRVGVDEKLGGFINLEARFRDENGRALRLKDFIKKPTLLLPVFFFCPRSCSIMLANLAAAVNDIPLSPGEDYQMMAVSFDADETPALAHEAKKNYLPLIKERFPENQWKFFTGRQPQIDELLQDLGYRLKKTAPHTFIHPNVLIVISGDGQIIRYLYGSFFLPFDIGMALTEASKGTPQLSIRRVLTYCFDYDSKKGTYVVNIFRVGAAGILVMLGLLLLLLLRKKHA